MRRASVGSGHERGWAPPSARQSCGHSPSVFCSSLRRTYPTGFWTSEPKDGFISFQRVAHEAQGRGSHKIVNRSGLVDSDIPMSKVQASISLSLMWKITTEEL